MRHLLVIGSINADLVVTVDGRPRPGETVRGGPLSVLPGGKGANQALAACRLGVEVSLVGSIGSDANAVVALRELKSSGVDVTQVRSEDATTGTAVIVVTPDGENQIVVSAGANGLVTPGRAQAAVAQAASDTLVLLQLELPVETVRAAAAAAKARGLRVVLNAAPVAELDPTTLAVCDPLVVNQTEAAALLGVEALSGDMFAIAHQLLDLGPRSVVVTLGAEGCLYAMPGEMGRVAAPVVDVVDTTGAGDAFAGALAATLCADLTLEDAASRGTIVGAIAVQSAGAQSSFPTASEVTKHRVAA